MFLPVAMAALQPVRLPAGPVLAGGGVLWAQQSGSETSIQSWRRGAVRVVLRLPAGGFVSLAGSRSQAAVATSASSCPGGGPCSALEDLLAGSLRESFRRILPHSTCTAQFADEPAVDLSGQTIAYADARCTRKISVLDLAASKPRVLFRFGPTTGCCASVRVAGRYVAWPRWQWISVYDYVAKHLVYRAPLGGALAQDFDLQPDGKLAVLTDRRVEWFSPHQPRPHVIGPRPSSYGKIRMAHDRIVYMTDSALVLSDLRGRTKTIDHFGGDDHLTADSAYRSDFDFDGTTIVWASDHVTSRTSYCPPQPMPPCVMRETGTTRIELRSSLRRKPLVIARIPFVDRVS